MEKSLLIIGQVWPEPETTGAGLRMMQLIHLAREMEMQVVFASTAQRSAYSYPLEQDGIDCEEIKLNHASFDEFISQLRPHFVMFDRFATEEQFSWRVAENCPDAVRILDSEDLHFLRAGRKALNKHPEKELFEAIPLEMQNRELASICRSDLTLVISEFEMDLLTRHYGVDPSLLFYLPFIFEPNEASNKIEFGQRNGYMCIGNWKHEPNKDAIHFLKESIWPLIKKAQPEAEVYIYGAYAARGSSTLHDPGSGFHLMGWAENKEEIFKKHRVCLAPLRFGAGLKGKLFDAMRFGTPVVSTSIGAEGLKGELPWNGCIADQTEEFANCAVALYNDQDSWDEARRRGFQILEERFGKEMFQPALKSLLYELPDRLTEHRRKNWIGSMLWHHGLLSTKYLSRWIEEKNRDH